MNKKTAFLLCVLACLLFGCARQDSEQIVLEYVEKAEQMNRQLRGIQVKLEEIEKNESYLYKKMMHSNEEALIVQALEYAEQRKQYIKEEGDILANMIEDIDAIEKAMDHIEANRMKGKAEDWFKGHLKKMEAGKKWTLAYADSVETDIELYRAFQKGVPIRDLQLLVDKANGHYGEIKEAQSVYNESYNVWMKKKNEFARLVAKSDS
ncbi:MAG: YkyA family protein [Bacillus sp. (in: firmicutes)]